MMSSDASSSTAGKARLHWSTVPAPLSNATPSAMASKVACHWRASARIVSSARRIRRSALMVATSTGGSTGSVR